MVVVVVMRHGAVSRSFDASFRRRARPECHPRREEKT